MPMCYKPLNIQVKSKYYSPSYSSLVHATVPCGHCMDCQHKKKDEVTFRTFYEARRCIDAGGFVLSQALTYRESDVPHIREFLTFSDKFKDLGDFYCFRRSDIRSFFMSLRNHLTRDLGLDIAYKLKYLLAAEYGTSDKGTHRPHYHVLFFSTVDGLTWQKLSAAIELCWKHGLSDGFLRMPESYFLNDLKPHVFYKGQYDSVKSLETAISYVTDYLVKDSVFEKEINRRLDLYCQYLHETQFGVDTSDLVRKFRRNCCQFRLNSPHFGDNVLDFNDFDTIFATGRIEMENSSDTLPRISITLPLYHARKLFYELRKDFDGTCKWCLTNLGEKFRLKRIQDYMKTFTRRYTDMYTFAPTDVRCRITCLLDGRSIDDFVDYLFLYKGRFITGYNSLKVLPRELQLKNICHTLYYKDKVGSAVLETFPEYAYRYYQQDTIYQFRFFDELFQEFVNMQMSTNVIRQTTDEFVQQLSKTIKDDKKRTFV